MSVAQPSSEFSNVPLLSSPHEDKNSYSVHLKILKEATYDMFQSIESDTTKVLDEIPSSVTSAHRRYVKQWEQALRSRRSTFATT